MQPVFLTLVRKRGQFAIQIWREERVKNFIESLQHFRVEDRTQVFGETKVKHKVHMYIHPSRGKEKRTQNYIIIELQSYRTTKLVNSLFFHWSLFTTTTSEFIQNSVRSLDI